MEELFHPLLDNVSVQLEQLRPRWVHVLLALHHVRLAHQRLAVLHARRQTELLQLIELQHLTKEFVLAWRVSSTTVWLYAQPVTWPVVPVLAMLVSARAAN